MRIHHIALRTRDLGRLLAFYGDLLGLETSRETPGHSVWLDAGGTIPMLERSSETEPDIGRGTQELIAFAAASNERAGLEARLASTGVAIEARTDHTVYFRDPDGRRVGLSHYPS